MHSRGSLLKDMATQLGTLPAQLEPIIRTAPLRYKVFTIPKRDRTLRVVAQPAREVKALQHYLISALTPILPIHDAAVAYRDGISIRDNANRHKSNRFLLKMDLKNFFPSIEASDIIKHLEIYAGKYFDESTFEIIVKICTWAPNRNPPLRLCIGAPSSPLISNSILYAFDIAINKVCIEKSITYTRYADDLIFSSQIHNALKDIPTIVRHALEKLPYPRLQVNDKKTVFASRGDLQIITGVVVKPDGELSAGRNRKRLARAMYDRFSKGSLSEKEQERMWGLIAFIDYLEPGYRLKLTAKS